jgi:hypothetical protein
VAKLVIKLINAVADVVNADPDTRGILQVLIQLEEPQPAMDADALCRGLRARRIAFDEARAAVGDD